MDKFAKDLNKALTALKDNGLSLGQGFVTPEGSHVFNVSGFLLTGSQILMLHEYGHLTFQGIKDFDTSERDLVEKDIRATQKLIPLGELKTWTPSKICVYVNTQFVRTHNPGQILAVLKRLGIDHA